MISEAQLSQLTNGPVLDGAIKLSHVISKEELELDVLENSDSNDKEAAAYLGIISELALPLFLDCVEILD